MIHHHTHVHHSTSHHSTAHHITSHHITAHHSTAQHSTSQHSKKPTIRQDRFGTNANDTIRSAFRRRLAHHIVDLVVVPRGLRRLERPPQHLPRLLVVEDARTLTVTPATPSANTTAAAFPAETCGANRRCPSLPGRGGRLHCCPGRQVMGIRPTVLQHAEAGGKERDISE